MRSLLRSLFVWLMVLALPLQGLAGTAMQHCAKAAQQSEHRSTAEAVQFSDVPVQPHGVTGHDHGHGHGHGHAQDPGTDFSSPAAAAPVAAHAADGDHHCSACAACCTAVGLPTWTSPLDALTATSTAPSLPRLAVDSFVPAGLDRPPRSGCA